MMVPRKFKIRRGATRKRIRGRANKKKVKLTALIGVPRPGAITKNIAFSGKENTPHVTGYKWENMKTDNLQI
ncbi:hypothetical protein QL374_004215 [Salmonella enterica]|nr:hypothetical protein [Salmonella enterica]